MARIKRQELKQDEFVDTMDALLLYLEENWRQLLGLVAIAAVVGGAVGGYVWYSRSQERKASLALTQALLTFQARVQAGLPALPGEGAEQTFSSEKEKYTAAEKKFAEVREKYPRTHAALQAQHYQAVCLYKMGETQKGLDELKALTEVGDKNEAALARFTLAGLYRDQGKADDAAKLYRQLIAKPTTTVPKALAMLQLAEMQSEKNPAEARQLYQQIKTEFPDSQVATEVSRRMDMLPPAPPAAPAPAEPPAQP